MQHVSDCKSFGYDRVVSYAQANQRCYETKAKADAVKALMESEVPAMFWFYQDFISTVTVDIPICNYWTIPNCRQLRSRADRDWNSDQSIKQSLDTQLAGP
jgi:hypothetical protein